MKRASAVLLSAALLAGSAALAQDAAPQNTSPDLSALEQTAQKRHAEWEALARDMNDRLARILPCDARSAAALAEVSRASDARLGALADYLRAVSAKAFAETADARSLLSAQEKRAADAGLERNDAAQEQTAVETQSDALEQSAKQRASLEGPEKVLAQIAAMIQQRKTSAEQQAGAAEAATGLLRDLVAKFEARDAALREEFAAAEAERARWNAYYAARRTRAQLECTITQIGGSASKSGKQ